MQIERKYTCQDCEVEYTLMLPKDGISRYIAGAHVQNAFPMLSPEERELMISGICGPCFDALLPEEEEEGSWGIGDDWFLDDGE